MTILKKLASFFQETEIHKEESKEDIQKYKEKIDSILSNPENWSFKKSNNKFKNNQFITDENWLKIVKYELMKNWLELKKTFEIWDISEPVQYTIQKNNKNILYILENLDIKII